jgi:glutathionylspermidine synthase
MIAEEFKRRHGEVSTTWRRFLEFVETNPDATLPSDMSGISCSYPIQSWPTFISAEKRREIANATEGIFRLLKSIPERIFRSNTAEIANYYKISPPQLTRHLLSTPNGLASAICRADFIDSTSGFKCLEFNPYGNLGGLETEFMLSGYSKTATFSKFVTSAGIEPKFERCVLKLFEHFIRDTRAQAIATDEVNIAAVVDIEENHSEANTKEYGPVYAQALQNVDSAIHGRLICCTSAELREKNGCLYHADTRIHGVWELGIEERCPQRFFIAFKSSLVSYYNSPFAGYLGDKRNLALLSQAAEGDIFDAAEKELIRRHVPWTRHVGDAQATLDGVTQPLLAHLRDQRPRLVLKKGFGMKGEQVFIGKSCSDAEWEATIQSALAEDDWVAQEYVEPKSFLYQSGSQGLSPYHVIWGTFCFGETYAGVYLRMSPATKAGPINSATGALTGLVFEG